MNKFKLHWSNLRSSFWHLCLLVKRATNRHLRVSCAVLSGFTWWSALTTPIMAQGDAAEPQNPPVPKKEELSLAPEKVVVQPIAHDEEIRKRLQSVIEATGWFVAPQVEVENGGVFLNGQAESDEVKKWAGDLARNTQDVVAVANRIEVSQQSAWDFRGARSGLSGLSCDLIRSLPLTSLLILQSRPLPHCPASPKSGLSVNVFMHVWRMRVCR